ncbi:hypothetical protein CDD81_1729 [Ophiocordyceps australis]|uniref:Uncharacterized protein n=1 Tax=Ophiocordyceps australis TaxID=1399860 RepID=A0A2C5YDF5_9HYPO|nr:hypothetical protein CDD81_1729 [Ophiocordyceps australis]
MLPSRGLTSSLPSSAARLRLQRLPRRNLSSLSTRLPRNDRQTSSALGALGGGGASGPTVASLLSMARHGHGVSPLLGSVAAPSARNFSLWPSSGGSRGSGNSPAPPSQTPSGFVAEPVEPMDPVEPLNPVDAQAASTSTMPEVSATEFDMGALNDAFQSSSALDILNMPERLGYLKAIGLDFGWGPTSVMQWALEHVHIMTGYSWTVSIFITAVIFRVLMFYPQMRSARVAEKTRRLSKDPRSIKAVADFQNLRYDQKDTEAVMRKRLIDNMLRREYGLRLVDLLWTVIPVPLAFGFFRIVNNMADVPVPALETGGFLWFTDLTAYDPYYILPIVNIAIAASTFYVSPTSMEQFKDAKPIAIAGFGILAVFLTSWLNNAVNLMGIALGATNVIALCILRIPWVRKKAGMSPINDTPENEPPPPPPQTASITDRPPVPTGPVATPRPRDTPPSPKYQPPRAPTGFRERITKELNDARHGFSKKVSNLTGSLDSSTQSEDKSETKRKENLRRIEELRHLRALEDFERKYKNKR